MVMITLYAKQKRDTDVQNRILDSGVDQVRQPKHWPMQGIGPGRSRRTWSDFWWSSGNLSLIKECLGDNSKKTRDKKYRFRTDFWTLWEKARVGCFKRTALKHVYYLGWNRSPAQVGCMRQALGPGALGRPRGSGWRGRWEGGSGWRIHVKPWLIHVNVWQNPLQYCKVISLQLIKINEKKLKIEEKECFVC